MTFVRISYIALATPYIEYVFVIQFSTSDMNLNSPRPWEILEALHTVYKYTSSTPSAE